MCDTKAHEKRREFLSLGDGLLGFEWKKYHRSLGYILLVGVQMGQRWSLDVDINYVVRDEIS